MSDISNIAAVEHYFALVNHANDSDEKFDELIAIYSCSGDLSQIIISGSARSFSAHRTSSAVPCPTPRREDSNGTGAACITS